MTSSFDSRPLEESELLSRARKIRAILYIHQDIIGYDAPVRSQILPDHNEHGAFEIYEKEDIISEVSDPPFTNFVQRSDSNEKPMLIG